MNELNENAQKDVRKDVRAFENNLNKDSSTRETRSGTDVAPDVPASVPPVAINLNKTSSTSGSESGIDVAPDVPASVPPVAINLTEITPTGGTPDGTLDPSVGPSTENDVRSIFRESKTFRNYFESNCNDETYNIFLDVHLNFFELPEAELWGVFTEWMLDRFIEERKNKKLQEMQKVLLEMIDQGFYTRQTKESLRNMSMTDAIDFIIKNMNSNYEVNVLKPKIERYLKYVQELKGFQETELKITSNNVL